MSACVSPHLQIWWLDPELTYGNAKPFVFTQGHSVCNRSFFPCFDTPAVKCTYSAVVKVRTSVGVVSAFPRHCPRPDLTAGLQMGSGYPLLYSSCLPTLGSQLRSGTVTQRSQRQALRRPGEGPRYSTDEDMVPDHWFPRPLDLQDSGESPEL